ncbi:MAG: lipid-A-disaccharide synthase [Candidatus Omnitrophica bacterium]|nr:lipid-A-disaccharide synthase [Candidatus Omnitrophota bacterium]
MGQPQKHFIIVAGEASGDVHAAHLVDELKKLDPSLTFSGIGGPRLQASGVELYKDISSLAVVGFVEVIKHYGAIRGIFNLILQRIDKVKPQAVILVDYPGFNLRLAREIKKRNVKVIYYISPQVWAWKANRVEQIQKYVDKMLVLFRFEQDFYARRGVRVDFVGHPLMDALNAPMDKNKFCQRHGLDRERLTIGLLPGSRQNEINTLLPIMLNAADILHKEFAPIQFLVLKAHTIERSLLERCCRNAVCQPRIIESETYDGINACHLCIVASGTATLETAILEKPMVIVYKTSFPTWLMAKLLVKIPYIGLVNVVAGKKIVAECVQFQATPEHIASQLRKIITDEIRIAVIKENLRDVKNLLGALGASQRAAEIIYESTATTYAQNPSSGM